MGGKQLPSGKCFLLRLMQGLSAVACSPRPVPVAYKQYARRRAHPFLRGKNTE